MLKTEKIAVKVAPAHKLALERLARVEDIRSGCRSAAHCRRTRRVGLWFDDPASVDYRGRTDAEYPAGVEL